MVYTIAKQYNTGGKRVYDFKQMNSTDRLTGFLGIAVRCIVVETYNPCL